MLLSFILILIKVLITICVTEDREVIRYVSTEHPEVMFYNKKYFEFVNMTSRRYGRRDPFYYVGLHLYSKVYASNNFSIHFYFYEFHTNRYERGFVELHFKLCDLIHLDPLFGAAMRQGRLAGPCPFPPGEYHLSNMTMSVKHIPRNFPFTKGRIYANLTIAPDQVLVSAYIDMEIKNWRVRRTN